MADRRLQVFHAVARHGSFTRAAEALFMTQPAVTFQIKQLEEHFSARLFDRGHGRVSLTSAGEIVFAYAERILGLNDELESRVAELTDELSGTLTFGVSTTIGAFWLPHLLEVFKTRYPRVIPRVTVGNSQLIESRVVDRSLDVGLVEIHTTEPQLERRPSCNDELLVVVAPGHPLAGAESLAARDLVEHPFITREPGNGIRDLADQFFLDAGIPLEDLTFAAELGSLSSVKHLASLGFGYAFASSAAIRREVSEGRLVAIPLSPRLFTPLEVILLKDRFRSRLITTFADFAADEFRRQCAR